MAAEHVEREHRIEAPLLTRARIRLPETEGVAGEAAEVGVSLPALGEQCEVRAHLRARVARRPGLGDGQLQAGDGPDPGRARRLRELHRPEHAVVIGQRERRVALLGGASHELVRARGALQQRVVAVRVQLHVRDLAQRLVGEGRRGAPRRPGDRRPRLPLRAPPLELVPALHVAGLELPAPACHGYLLVFVNGG